MTRIAPEGLKVCAEPVQEGASPATRGRAYGKRYGLENVARLLQAAQAEVR